MIKDIIMHMQPGGQGFGARRPGSVVFGDLLASSVVGLPVIDNR